MKTEQELRNILGKNIKDRRKQRDWSQQELADKIDVSKNFISDLETGQKFTSAQTLINLANILETEVYELLKPESVPPDKPADIIVKYGEQVKDAVDKIRDDYLVNMKP
jgi:transcriptional regulator with XRE-family HTH domain